VLKSVGDPQVYIFLDGSMCNVKKGEMFNPFIHERNSNV